MPFYLRTGKRFAKRRSEIVVQFRPVPHLIFPGAARDMAIAGDFTARNRADRGQDAVGGGPALQWSSLHRG